MTACAQRISELIEEAAEAPKATVFLPGGMGDVETTVETLLERTFKEFPQGIRAYVTVMDYLWPQLRRSDEKAFMLIVCEVYLALAEKHGFKVDLEQLDRGYDDSGRLHRNTEGDDSTPIGKRS